MIGPESRHHQDSKNV